MKKISINLKNVTSVDDFEPITPGDYTVNISGCEIRTSLAGNECLFGEFTVVNSKFANRKLFDHFVLTHDVGLRRLKSMVLAAKFPTPDHIDDPSMLIGLRLLVKVAIRDSEEFGRQNKIVAFKPLQPDESSSKKQKPQQLGLDI